MTAKELIDRLKEVPEDTLVVAYDNSDFGGYSDIIFDYEDISIFSDIIFDYEDISIFSDKYGNTRYREVPLAGTIVKVVTL